MSSLKQAFGEQVELLAEDGEAEAYKILAELTVNGNRYAILQSEAMQEDDEFDVFQVIEESGKLGLESVTDEDEWELVAEAYDDIQFGSEDRP
jgi:uncharacterized protein YrzB (UPF0473 family)